MIDLIEDEDGERLIKHDGEGSGRGERRKGGCAGAGTAASIPSGDGEEMVCGSCAATEALLL